MIVILILLVCKEKERFIEVIEIKRIRETHETLTRESWQILLKHN